MQVEVKQGTGFKTECRAGGHLIVIDQPLAAGGSNEGPTPLDVQLMALGACIAAIGRIIALQQRLPVRGFNIFVEGELDTDRALGKSAGKRAGFSAIVARVKLDADLPPSEQEKLLREIEARCPVSDNLKNGTSVNIFLAS